MLTRLKMLSDRKKTAILKQASEIKELIEECENLCEISSGLVSVGSRKIDESAGLYMVGAAHVVKRRSLELKTIFDKLPKLPLVDPHLSAHFDQIDDKLLLNAISALGYIDTSDCPPHLNQVGIPSEADHGMNSTVFRPSVKHEGGPSFELGQDTAPGKEDCNSDIIRIPLALTLSITSRWVLFYFYNSYDCILKLTTICCI